MWRSCLLCLVIFALVALTGARSDDKPSDEGRRRSRFAVFNIVKFPNDICDGNNNKNGTCYTEQECSNRGGSNSGTCADGFGVCCTFTLECGDKATENVTYFESTGTESGYCQSRVCSVSSNICQIRLDFNTFVINQPSTDTLSSGKQLAGIATLSSNKPVTNVGQCLTDSFSVVSPGVSVPSAICGTNTGEHMYVDVQMGGCIDLLITLGATTTVSRSWNIKVSQYECSYDNLAPSGCTKYYFGSTTGYVKTYNFDSGLHIADQKDNMCIRRERGQCRICYSTTAAADFDVSGKAGADGVIGKSSMCCGYGKKAQDTNYDCAIIPAASKKTTSALLTFDKFCGGGAAGLAGGLFTAAGATAKTVCSKVLPFKVTFISDNYEFVEGTSPDTEAEGLNNGLKLAYVQSTC